MRLGAALHMASLICQTRLVSVVWWIILISHFFLPQLSQSLNLFSPPQWIRSWGKWRYIFYHQSELLLQSGSTRSKIHPALLAEIINLQKSFVLLIEDFDVNCHRRFGPDIDIQLMLYLLYKMWANFFFESGRLLNKSYPTDLPKLLRKSGKQLRWRFCTCYGSMQVKISIV